MMKNIAFFILYTLCFMLCMPLAHSAERQARAGAPAGMRGAIRSGTTAADAGTPAVETDAKTSGPVLATTRKVEPEPEEIEAEEEEEVVVEEPGPEPEPAPVVSAAPAEPEEPKYSCDDYEDCMDAFCLLDESEGERCACSDNIEKSKSMIKKIQDTQAKAEKLYGEGVEKEKLGAKAVLVFGQSDKAKASRVDLSAWLNNDDEEEMDDDAEIGDYLFNMASKSCKARLDACGADAKMKSMLYSRKITADCKSFTSFLNAQQKVADSNVAAAEKAVRSARFAELGNTNKYNRGECLIALRNCVAEKGGCGDNFENCLDKGLLARRTNACENITDQCMAVKKDVMKDWEDETKLILAEAEKYADKYFRQTCLSKIENCLEDTCSTGSNDQCLNDVRVASGVCPIITECNAKIPGITDVVNSKLGYLRIRFCQNDLESCFRDKCGADYTKPECLGKPFADIAKLCPADIYPSCKGQQQVDVLVSSIFLRMDYAQMQGCINYFAENLGKVCGTDMSCIPDDPAITNLASTDEAAELFKPTVDAKGKEGPIAWKAYADKEVDGFFAELEKDSTIGACADNQNPKTKVKGRQGIGASVFNTAKLIAKINAENRQYRALVSKMRELAKAEDTEKARAACELMKEDKGIDSVAFEPDLRNCHICRTQKVCEEGGESKATGALKAAGGGLAAGASMGTMVSPGWGSAIGGVVGAAGGALMGAMSSDEKEFCQEIQSCEDVNM